MPGWTFVFLWLTVLTCATGFPLPPFGWDPPRIIGVITLLLLAGSIGALYIFRLDGSWRLVYVATAVASLYLNVFVLVVQGFLKVPFITAFAPTQSELPFLIAHILVLAIFVCLGFMALGRFRPRR